MLCALPTTTIQLRALSVQNVAKSALKASLGCSAEHDQWHCEYRPLYFRGQLLTPPKLIETGRALRPSDKEGGRSLTNAGTRLKSIVPGAIESFHQALDDLEYDIVRMNRIIADPNTNL